jgi:hypothetical protein
MQQIVQEVEIAEALLGHYVASLSQADVASMMLSLERDQRLANEAAIGSAEQVYPEIWKRLDAARAIAAPSGRDCAYYDQIRSHVGADAANGIKSVTTVTTTNLVGVVPVLHGGSKIAEGNADGVRAARDAIATFRSVFPDLPWHDPSEPVPELRTGQSTAKLMTIIGALLLVAAIIALRSQL